MEKMYQDYKDIAEFRMVYIREAHASDSSWPVEYAKEKGITDHKNYEQRCTTADMLFKDKKLTIPCVIDDMDDAVNKAYGAWPDRVYVVRTDGRLAVAAKRGPWGFKPALDETAKWLAEFRKTEVEPALPKGAIEAALKREAEKAKEAEDQKSPYTSKYPMGPKHQRPIIERDGKTLLWALGDPDGEDAEWFDMTDSAIDPAEFQYGIGKDRIPSIDEPEFARYGDPKLDELEINDETKVVGFEHRGIARAYPIEILNGHEVVNDNFKGTKFAVCW